MTEETLKEKCIRLEHFETPEWAARAILKREKLSGIVIDPCCGTGILARVDAPHLRDNGFTLGLKRNKPRGWYGFSPDMFTIDGEYHPQKPGCADLWAIDQLKGRKNSTLHDDDLQYFCDLITGEVNKIMQSHETKS